MRPSKAMPRRERASQSPSTDAQPSKTSSPVKRPQSAMASYPIARSSSRLAMPNSRSSSTLKYDIFNDPSFEPKNTAANVKVVVRVRPFLPRETIKECVNLISMNSNTTTINPPPVNTQQTSSTRAAARRNADPKSFTFDYSFWSCNKADSNFADQQRVYDCVGREFLDHNMEGYHTCIFAYGQTGSGKSHTMMGNDTDPGLIPRTCEDLFERVEKMTSGHVTCTVRVSYFEVYNEQVRDLLVTSKESTGPNVQQPKLRVRESPTEGPYVEDLSEFSVKTAGEVLKYLASGNKARSTAATKMNDVSSRSHAVFTLVVKQVITDPVTDATEEKTSRIRLVDLAGSERANSTGATGQRLREGSNINKSLTTLGRVIAALADTSSDSSPLNGRNSPIKKKSPNLPSSNAGGEGIIPYRDSTLTWLLKDSLGGNSKTAMVACIAPTDYDEGLSTLRYADQAKSIRTRAVVNQDIVSAADRDKLLAEMQERINSLQSSLLEQQQQDKDSGTSALELEKVKSVIRFYEDKAIAEESKRRAIQAENNAVKRHNKLLTDHLKEVTNKTIGNMKVVVENKSEDIGEGKENRAALPDRGTDEQAPSFMVVPTLSYEVLNDELQELLADISGFKTNLQADIKAFSN